MKNKIALIVSIVVLFIFGGLIAVALGRGWFSSLASEVSSIREEMDKTMNESILKQMSETPQDTSESQLVSINASGQKNYDWQSIEDLLRRGSDSIEITDYVALLQVVESMTEVHTDGAVTTDFEAIGQLAQRGYQGAYLTPAMANTCILYKEWVEDYVLVAPKTYALFHSRKTEEEKTLAEYLEQEMLKAVMLGGILMNDHEITQSKDRVSQHIPEVNIIYEQQEENNKHYLIQIGDKNIEIYPFRLRPDYTIDKARDTLSLDDAQERDKNEELLALQREVDAYAIAAALAISEDRNIQLVICFEDTELEIRARAYDQYLYEKAKKEGKGPKYLNLTASNLKAQFISDDTAQTAEYTKWWGDYYGQISYKNYKRDLTYYTADTEFVGKIIEDLTPAQIRELDKKIKDPNYTLNMGDVP
ncbi:MAG: hypothetical protein FWG14_10475 [Peptococcaceae bacterium]|nr:hypothetical protein [Peptococcaceae bacterium]